MRLLLLLPLVLLSPAATAASTTTAVVLPVDGPGLLPTLRADLEGAVRARLAAEQSDKHARFTLTSTDDVAAVLQDAGGAGLACSLDDAACVVRIGVIAGVDEVFVTSAVQTGGALQLRVTRVDIARRRAVVVGAGVVVPAASDGGDSVARVVGRVLAPPATVEVNGPAGTTVTASGVVLGKLPLPAPIALDVGPRDLQALDGGRLVARASVDVVAGHQATTLQPLAVTAPTTTTTTLTTTTEQPPAPASSGPSPLMIGGGVALGTGGLILGVCGVGALAVEAGLNTPQPGADDPARVKGQRDLGAALVGAAALGAVVTVAGAILFGMGMP